MAMCSKVSLFLCFHVLVEVILVGHGCRGCLALLGKLMDWKEKSPNCRTRRIRLKMAPVVPAGRC